MNKRASTFAVLAMSLLVLSAFSSLLPTTSNTTATATASNATILPPSIVATNMLEGNGDFAFSVSLDGRQSQAQRNEEFTFTNERSPLLAPKSGYQTIIIDQRSTDTNYNSRQIFQLTDSQDRPEILKPTPVMIGTIALATLIDYSMRGVGILIVFSTVLSFFASRWKVCYRSQLWGVWGVGFLLGLGLLLSTIWETGRFLHAGGFHPSLTGLENLAAIEILGFSAGAIVPIVISFFIVKRRLGAPIPGFVLLGACTGCVILLAIGIGSDRASRVKWTLLVQDTEGKPVEGAQVSWKVYGYGPEGTRPAQPSDQRLNSLTDAQGRVMVYGREGLYEMIGRVQKAGYAAVDFSIGMTFDKWQKSRDVRFESDRAHPHQPAGVPAKGKFSLVVPLTPENKLVEAKPLYVFSPYGDITVGAEPLILNVEKGKIAAQGDLAFSVALGAETNRYGSDFIVTMQGLNGAGFVFSNEEFLSKAPESGYENTFTVTHKVNVPNYKPEQVFRFYVRTGTGKYASVGVKIKLWGDFSKADFEAGIHFNPSGSRNLEFDQNKWINR